MTMKKRIPSTRRSTAIKETRSIQFGETDSAWVERNVVTAIAIPAASTSMRGRIQRNQTTASLNTINKKVCPPGESRGRVLFPGDPDSIARDKERENEAEAGKERDLAPRDRTPVYLSTSYDCLRIEGEPDEREREGEENEDSPPGPFSYQCFLRIGE